MIQEAKDVVPILANSTRGFCSVSLMRRSGVASWTHGSTLAPSLIPSSISSRSVSRRLTWSFLIRATTVSAFCCLICHHSPMPRLKAWTSGLRLQISNDTSIEREMVEASAAHPSKIETYFFGMIRLDHLTSTVAATCGSYRNNSATCGSYGNNSVIRSFLVHQNQIRQCEQRGH